jgi:hypothetical protein
LKSLYCVVLVVVLLSSCESVPTGNALLTAMAQPTKTFIFDLAEVPTQIPPTSIPPTSIPPTPIPPTRIPPPRIPPTPTPPIPIPTTPISPTSIPPTLAPLSELDLEPILFMPGDLPDNYEVFGFFKEIPRLHDITDSSYPAPDVFTALEINDLTKPKVSYVVVMLYNDLAQLTHANNAIGFSTGYGSDSFKDLSGVGETAYIFKKHSQGYEAVIFIRCNALVYMLTTGNTATYAQRLDERLTELVCR